MIKAFLLLLATTCGGLVSNTKVDQVAIIENIKVQHILFPKHHVQLGDEQQHLA